ncbi:MAG: PAS domain S-box protein [Candidatus Omnitrophica bacterium]|nr:PAS domain S-box protein [Candidatus Omnitrophota bacterium]
MDATRVLLVENNPQDVGLITDMLAAVDKKDARFDLVHVDRLSEALRFVACEECEVVLLELELPDSSGLETFLRLNAKARHLPIVIVARSDDDALALEAVKKGAQDYLVKGVVNPRMLARVIRYAIERKRSDEALKESRERTRIIIESAGDAFFAMDENGRVTDWNRQAEVLFGFGKEEALGRPVWDLIVPASQKQSVKEDIARFVETGESFFLDKRTEMVLAHHDGREFPAEIASWPTRSGTSCSFSAFVHDITERKKLERLKDDFINMVSHELRTPLTAIKESVAVVEDGTVGPVNTRQKHFLESAMRNVERLGRFINKVLDYQKVGSHESQFHLAPHDLNALILEVKKGFDLVAGKKGLKIETDLDKALPLVTCDKDKIAQVLANFLTNAIKFSKRGRILVRTVYARMAAQVGVIDEGVGIREEDVPKLFKSFSQVPDGSERAEAGSGLGLAISDRIIRGHQGKIGVQSVYGKGSTFYFVLPIPERRT